VASHEGRIVRELAALALIAIAAWVLLSLISINLGWRPNRGGPLGDAAAILLLDWFGYQAYLVVILAAVLGLRAWAAPGSGAVLREAAGGAVLLLALSAGGGFLNVPGIPAGGSVGAAIAIWLGAYVSFGGGYIVVVLMLVGGLALMLRRAPTDLVTALASASRFGSGSHRTVHGARDQASDVAVPGSAPANGTGALTTLREPIKVATLGSNGTAAARA